VDVFVDDQVRIGEEVQVSDHDELWTSASQALRDQVSEAVWYSTFQDAVALPAGPRVLRIGVPSAHVRDRILTRYFSLLRLALDEIDGDDIEVEVEVSAPTEHVPDPPVAAQQSFDDLTRSVEPAGGRFGLNPRYTFETFVKGTSNQFALAASQRVAEVPARSYNPLFIYGAAGLGKTHLLHAIGHYVLQNYAHYQVLYVSTETFLNEYVDGIRTNTIASFKRRYRDIDVLLIDDIQFMEGKEGLQEEFFHTFNSLHGANKQIIISSDRMPDAIPTLEERLRGRFKWGLITDIQPPDMETRLAILRNKAEREASPVASEVLEFIATHITSNIRELEGALIRVSAYASLNQVPVSVEKAQHLLADLLTENTPKVRTDQEMLEEIAGLLGYPVEQLCGKSRQRPLVTARQIAMYVFRQITDLSYPSIARLFGGRDHTTVIHAVDKIERLMKERKQIFDQVNDLTQRLKMA
jgi:chromosomal replication initiator protein